MKLCNKLLIFAFMALLLDQTQSKDLQNIQGEQSLQKEQKEKDVEEQWPSKSDTQNMFDALSLEAEQTLLEYRAELNLGRITDAPVAIYRFDLHRDYIAYWEIETDSGEFIIISSGPETGDGKFAFQGQVPTKSQQVDELARAKDSVCARYYLVNFAADLACEDEEGNLVATTEVSGPANESEAIHSEKEMVHRAMWQEQAKETASEWLDETVMTEQDLEELQDFDEQIGNGESMGNETIDLDDNSILKNEAINEYAIEPGKPVMVALSDAEHLRYVEVIVMSTSEGESAQKTLCKLLAICDKTENSLVSERAIMTDPDTGLKMLKLEVAESANDQFPGLDVSFLILIHRNEDVVVVKRYGIDLSSHREKRRTERGPWSGWSVRSIPCSYRFPNYNQHRYTRNGKTCAVGCGPVAWAMVFGYMDRASHSGCKQGGEALFRCGSDGISGSNTCQAPFTTTSQVMRYTEHLNSVMGTFCAFKQGATFPWRMDDVAGFYRQRQTNGRLIQEKTFRSNLGINQESIASWTRARINEGWPVVVGYKIRAFAWHYPVAVGYRTRTRRYRRCFWRWCGSWKTERQYQMNLNMGWGGSSNTYYPMKVFHALAAVYP